MARVDLKGLRPNPGAKTRKKRLARGRGSGTGKTAGRGQKGAGARTGRVAMKGFEGGQMPLQRRVPKRGFRNPFKERPQIVAVGRLEAFENGTIVDAGTLRRERIVRKPGPVKILSDGELTKKLTVRVDSVSAKAREKIVAAGGTVESV